MTGETPDAQDAIFEFDGWSAAWSHREGSRGERPEFSLIFYGTKGSLGVSRRGFRVIANTDVPPAKVIPQFTGAHPVGGPQKNSRPVDPPGLVPKSSSTRPATATLSSRITPAIF